MGANDEKSRDDDKSVHESIMQHENPPSENASQHETDTGSPINEAEKNEGAQSSYSPARHSVSLETSDTANPLPPLHSAFTKRWKIFIVVMSAFGSFLSPLSTNIYLPALIPLEKYYGVSATDINLTISVYLIFQGLAPTFIGDFADQSGHRPAFLISMILYFAANIGCALQTSFSALLVLRCLQSAGASGTIALRNGVIAEVFTPAERGTWLGLMQAGNLLSPAFSPLAGSALTDRFGWRSTFWFLVILTGVYIVPYILFMPETNRKVVGNGSIPAQSWWNKSVLDLIRPRREYHKDEEQAGPSPLNARIKHKIKWPKPWNTLLLMKEKDVATILLFTTVCFAQAMDVIITIPKLYSQAYSLSEIQIGLCYIPLGLGCAVAAIGNGRMLNFTYRRIARANGYSEDTKRKHDLRHFPIEKARLQTVFPMIACQIMVSIAYGWTIDRRVHLAAPLTLLFFNGAFAIAAFTSLTNLLVDLVPASAATVTAAANLCRSLIVAGATAAINPMFEAFGPGWAFTTLSLILTACTPLLLLELKKGPQWREERYLRLERKAAARAQEKKDGTVAER